MPSITPKTETVVLMEGDDLAKLKELEAAVDAAFPTNKKRIADKSDMLAAAEAYDQFCEQALERAWHVTVVAQPRKVWARMREEAGPPRPGWKLDETRGYNNEAMAELLIPESITEIVHRGEPTPTKGPQFDAFLESLDAGDWSRLYKAAVDLNTNIEEPPKADMSSNVSLILRETLTSREASG